MALPYTNVPDRFVINYSNGSSDSKKYTYYATYNKWVSDEIAVGMIPRSPLPASLPYMDLIINSPLADGWWVWAVDLSYIVPSNSTGSLYWQVAVQYVNQVSHTFLTPVSYSTGAYVAGAEYAPSHPILDTLSPGGFRISAGPSQVGSGTIAASYFWATCRLAEVLHPNALSDNFDGRTSATDPGSATSGQRWFAFKGTWGTTGGKMYSPTGAAWDLVYAKYKLQNFSGSAKITQWYSSSANYNLGILAICGVSPRPGVLDFIGLEIYNGQLVIFKYEAGGFVALTSAAGTTPASGTEATMTFTKAGNVISCTVGAATVTYTLNGADATKYGAAVTSGFVGLVTLKGGAPPAGNVTFDDLSIV
jgi:hypothetical protein